VVTIADHPGLQEDRVPVGHEVVLARRHEHLVGPGDPCLQRVEAADLERRRGDGEVRGRVPDRLGWVDQHVEGIVRPQLADALVARRRVGLVPLGDVAVGDGLHIEFAHGSELC
jgi:hypothetical protein